MGRIAAVVSALVLTLAACGGDGPTRPTAGTATDGTATVVSITDGDTIRVDIAGRQERVRFIGVDTPETHGQGGLRECFGQEASKRTAQLLPVGSKVKLVRDAEPRDRYGRLLAYVYKPDGTFVNLTLAREGYAAVLTIPPNVAHADAFVEAVQTARDKNLGLWKACGGPDTPLPSLP